MTDLGIGVGRCGNVLQLFNCKCRSAERRARLSHSWLQRRLLHRLKSRGCGWVEVEGQTALPQVLRELPSWITETRELLVDLSAGYSPAQVVDRCLAATPDEIRTIIKKDVHNSYLDAVAALEPLAAELEAALLQFEAVAERVPRAWSEGGQTRLDTLA